MHDFPELGGKNNPPGRFETNEQRNEERIFQQHSSDKG
jgi:hypothetical protein